MSLDWEGPGAVSGGHLLSGWRGGATTLGNDVLLLRQIGRWQNFSLQPLPHGRVKHFHVIFHKTKSIKQRSNSLRRHFANGIEIEHRCSQASQSYCWDADMLSVPPGKEVWGWGSALPLQRLHAKETKYTIFVVVVASFHKSKKPLWNFQLAKTGANVCLSWKQNGIKWTFEKQEYLYLFLLNCSK